MPSFFVCLPNRNRKSFLNCELRTIREARPKSEGMTPIGPLLEYMIIGIRFFKHECHSGVGCPRA